MPITILDYVKSVVGEKTIYTVEDFSSACVEMLGGCEICGATIAPYNAYPSLSGYWRCADCIGDTGFANIEEFMNFDRDGDRAVDWLLRLRQLQKDGMDFDSALAQANAGADQNHHDAAEGPAATYVNCPACGGVENISEIWENVFKCGDCGSAWRL